MLTIDFPRLADRASMDDEFRIASRHWTAVLEIQVAARKTELLVDSGKVTLANPGDAATEALPRVAVRASEEDWERLLRRYPPPGSVDVVLADGFVYEGEPTERAAYHGAVRRLVDLMREQLHGPKEELRAIGPRSGDAEIIGRYVHLEVDGVRYRVYYEEAGAKTGIPVVMQHTAGSDGRQWRHILADSDYHDDFRLIAYDLPFHGKSLPPSGVEWWAQDYMPTRAFLFAFLAELNNALGLDRPVFMGCSIGGLMAPVLAYERPDEYRAVIGINAGVLGTFEPPATSPEVTQLGYLLDVYFHPRVGNDWKASGVFAFMAPASPEAARRETSWLYGCGAPPVFFGDIVSYGSEFNLTEDQLMTIDTGRVAVYLLTGEYDPFAIGGGTLRLAECIEGCHHEIIPVAGHFAHSDNPERFKESLDPVLRQILARG